MALTVVTDLATLLMFLEEIGELWREASDMMRFSQTYEERKFGIELCKMYITLNTAIIKEAELLRY